MGQGSRLRQKSSNPKSRQVNIPHEVVTKKRKARFESMESVLTVAVVLVVIGAIIPIGLAFFKTARVSVINTNVKNIYSATLGAFAIESFDNKDVLEFAEKYSEFQSTEKLFSGDNPVEISISEGLSNMPNGLSASAEETVESTEASKKSLISSIKGYVKFELSDDGINCVYMSEYEDGKDAIVYP